jgi:hypothetical protein
MQIPMQYPTKSNRRGTKTTQDKNINNGDQGRKKKPKKTKRCWQMQKTHLLQNMLCYDIIQKSGQATTASRSPQ